MLNLPVNDEDVYKIPIVDKENTLYCLWLNFEVCVSYTAVRTSKNDNALNTTRTNKQTKCWK